LWLYLIEGKSGKDTTDSFDSSSFNVFRCIKEEGTKIKEMVDRHIEKMIATLREKTRHEKELITKTLVDYKQELEKAKEIEKREHKTQQSKDDACLETLMIWCLTSFHESIISDILNVKLFSNHVN
jgi:phosphoglycerate-specific signal transduction histidine kinase